MTQNKDSTRYYSNIQEKNVANFLSGKVVAGSGSDKFAPGDVKTDKYLIECKTHVKETNIIEFQSSHWDQIVSEAARCGRFPVLCVDNGTQKIETTFILTNEHSINIDDVDLYKLPIIPDNKNIRFSCYVILNLFTKLNDISESTIPGFAFKWNEKYNVVIMRIRDFKDVMFT